MVKRALQETTVRYVAENATLKMLNEFYKRAGYTDGPFIAKRFNSFSNNVAMYDVCMYDRVNSEYYIGSLAVEFSDNGKPVSVKF